MGESILVVEDEEGILMALEDRLGQEGYTIECEANGVRAEEKARKGNHDLIILDIMLPGRDGFQICQNLRASAFTTPILMLTARGSNIDTIMGLRIGADDYLPKPFDMQVLLARIQALLRRSKAPKMTRSPAGMKYTIGDFVLDTEAGQLRQGDSVVPMNAQEYRLLQFFAAHPGKVWSRDDLLNEVWGYDTETTTRTVDVHVAWLRQKLDEKDLPRHIVTVRGRGYKFVDDD